MKVDDKTSEVLGRNFELSIDDAERLYNIGNFEKFSYSKIMSRAGQDLLLETAKTPVRLLGAVGQIPYAVETGAKFIRDRLPSSVKTDGNVIFGGETAVDIMGKAKSVGDTLMEVSSRTLDEINKRAEKLLPRLSPEEQESTFNTYAQVGTQLSALLGLSMMSPKAGLDYITALTLGGETEEGFETYKAKNKGSMEGYGEQAGKDLFANLANTAIQRKIEGLIGIPGKMKFFRSAKELGRAGLYAGATGWLEEGTQGLTDAIIDDFNGRLEGQVDKDGKPLTWWTKWLSQVQEINAAAVVQGAMGVGFALNNRASVKNEIKSIVEKHVEPEKVNEVVNTVYDSMDLSIKNVVAKELEMSSSLQTKRGEVYESLYKAALEQVKVAKEQGGFPELQTEEDIANYVKGVADRFADETLAEAHRRNTVIEDVLDPSLIRYENGQLVMPMTKGTEGFDADKIMAERTTEFSYDEILHKLRFEEMSAEEEQRLTDMLDVEKQRLAPLFDTARGVVEELENEYGLVNELTDLSDAITERKMSFKEARDALGESFPEEQLADLGDEIKLKEGVKGNSAEIGFEYLTNRVFDRYDELRAKAKNYRLLQESLDIANQNAELDANNPAYEGETININGVERSVYNSNGDRIAMSEPALRNFYKWFGDSKVVDEQGRPLVVYHGSPATDIQVFDKSKIGLRDYGYFGKGFYFTPNSEMASFYYTDNYDGADYDSGKVYPVYLNLKNPKYARSIDEGTIDTEELKEQGYDGVIVYSFNEYSESVRESDPYVRQEIEDAKNFTNEWWQLKNYEDEVIGKKIIDEIVAFEPNQIKSTSNRGTYSENDNIYHQFVGEKAQGIDKSLLAEAKKMHAMGASKEHTRQTTGWFIGGDGKWRFEISDKDMKIDEKLVKKAGVYNLKDIIEHKELFKMYPFLENIEVTVMDFGRGSENNAAGIDPVAMTMQINTRSNLNLRISMAHEIQHLIQVYEGFAQGSVPNAFETYKKDKVKQRDKIIDELVKKELSKQGYNDDDFTTLAVREAIKDSDVDSYNKKVSDIGDYWGMPKNVIDDISMLVNQSKEITDFDKKYPDYKDDYEFYIHSGGEVESFVTGESVDLTMEQRLSNTMTERENFYISQLGQLERGKIRYEQEKRGSIEFRGNKALITLTEQANSSTLAHELAHYWLQNTFLYSKSGLATPEYKQFFNSIAKYLDITDDQETIKEWQQEKWARAAEMYAMGKAPEGMEKPLTQYQQWIRKAYGEMSEPMYIDENGEAKVPEFDFETMKMFANLAGETLTEPEFKQKQEAVRGLAKSTNQMAQTKGMKTELPTYEKRSATDMGKKADEFIQRDKQLAIDIVKGLKPEQEGLFRQDLFAALRELALNEGDSDLLNELSKSMTVEEATELGQRIQALARGRIDPVKQMVELRDERMKKNKVDKKKLKEETEKAKKEIKKEMAEASTPKEWADFIKSLEC